MNKVKDEVKAERQEVVNLILHFKGQGLSFRTMTPLINELGFLSVTRRVFDHSVLNKIFKNQGNYINYNPYYRRLDYDLRKVDTTHPNLAFKVTSNGDYVIRNERLKEVLFRSDSCKETFNKFKELQTM